MSEVSVSSQILKWALNRQGTSLSKLQKKFPKLNDWIQGDSKPTLKQLESLAKATHTPFGFFFLTQPPSDDLPIPHYRTTADEEPSAPSPDLLETVQLMQRRQAWIREYLTEQGIDRLEFVGAIRPSENIKHAAQVIRKYLNVKSDWASEYYSWTEALSHLKDIIEEAGILVAVNGIVGNNTKRKLSVEEFRGFVLADSVAPLVFVNGADAKAAQMFTLAHELAHVFMGSSAAFDLREMQAANNPTEQACNAVAAEFLVPENELRIFWERVKSGKNPFQQVARNFKVSFIVAARRGLDLKLISRTKFHQIYSEYLLSEHRSRPKSAGGNFYASQNLKVGRKFGTTVLRAVKEGRLPYSDAYRLTGLQGSAFSKFAKSQGIEV